MHAHSVRFEVVTDDGALFVDPYINSLKLPGFRSTGPSNITRWQRDASFESLHHTDKHESSTLELGNELLALLFSEEGINSAVKSVIEDPNNAGSIIPIGIVSNEPTVYGIPWETIAFANWNTIGISRENPAQVAVIRAPDVPELDWSISEPIKILVASSSPLDGFNVNLDKEYNAIYKSLYDNKEHYRIRLPSAITNATKGSLGDEVYHRQPQVVHMVTHGGEGILQLEDEDGYIQQIKPHELVEILNESNEIGLFVSTACLAFQENLESMSPGFAHYLSGRIPFSVGMQLPIQGQMSVDFTKVFYTYLARSKSILRAFVEARNRLYTHYPNTPAWVAPVIVCGARNSCTNNLFSRINLPLLVDEYIDELEAKIIALRMDARNKRTLKKIGELFNKIEVNLLDKLDRGNLVVSDDIGGIFQNTKELVDDARENQEPCLRMLELDNPEFEFKYNYAKMLRKLRNQLEEILRNFELLLQIYMR